MKNTSKIIAFLLIFLSLNPNNIMSVNAAETESDDPMQRTISDLKQGYSEYYDISNVETNLVSKNETDGYVENIYSLEMNAVLKADCVEEMEYYQGIADYCNIVAAASNPLPEISNMLALEQETIYNELQEYIGKEQCLTFYLKETYPIDNESEKMILFENGKDYVTWTEILPASREKLQEEGYARMANVSNENHSLQTAKLSYSYSVADAVSYMTRYTSNPSSCNACGNSNCGNYVDTRKYNSNYAHYASNHSDCANYISQALSNGGIPEDGTWKPNSSTWINVTNLTGYMTSHGYWSSVSYNVLQKGDILRFKNGSHVAMITSFDGTTYRYSGHTNDRLNTVINPTSSLAYYYRVG